MQRHVGGTLVADRGGQGLQLHQRQPRPATPTQRLPSGRSSAAQPIQTRQTLHGLLRQPAFGGVAANDDRRSFTRRPWLRFQPIDVRSLQLLMRLGVRDGVVVDLHRVPALPEQVVLHGRDERLLPFAITVGELGREGNALRGMQVAGIT